MSQSSKSLIWLLSYISIASVSATIITPAIPQIQNAFGLSAGGVEWVVSAFLIGYVMGQLIYGPLANRYGRLKALRWGLLINLVGIGLCFIALFALSYPLLVLGRLVTALGTASGLACTYMLINEWLPENQRKAAMGYATLSFALGIGIAVLLGGFITEYWQWQGCFWFLLGHGLIMLWGTRVFSETLKMPKSIHPKVILQDYTEAFSSMKLITFALVVGSCSAISYCFAAAGPQIAHDTLHLSAASYGAWNSLNIVGMLIGGLLSKKLLHQWRVMKVIVLGYTGCLIGIINLVAMWLLDSNTAWWFFTISGGLYLFSGFLFSGGAYIASNALTDKAVASSVMSFINMSFATLCVIIMGYLLTAPFVSFILILCFIALLTGGLLIHFVCTNPTLIEE